MKRRLPAAPLWLVGLGEAVQAVLVTALCLGIPAVLVIIATDGFPQQLMPVLATVAQTWLVIHGVPVMVSPDQDTWFHLMPMALTLLPLWVAWRAGRRLAQGAYPTQLWQGLLLLVLGYAAASVGISVVAEGDPGSQVMAGAVTATLIMAGSVAGCYAEARSVGRMFGMDVQERIEAYSQRLKWAGAYLWSVIRAAVVASVASVGAATLMLGVWLALHWMPIANAYQVIGAGLVGSLALTILHVGVAPNLVLWTLSYSTGAGFSVGEGAPVGPWRTEWSMVPEVPVLAALPGGTEPWSVAVVALPVLAGVAAGWWLMREGENHFDEWCQLKISLRPVSVILSTLVQGLLTGLVTAVIMVGPFWMSHISLGVGRMIDFGPHALLAAGLLGGWVAAGTVIGYALTWGVSRFPRRAVTASSSAAA